MFGAKNHNPEGASTRTLRTASTVSHDRLSSSAALECTSRFHNGLVYRRKHTWPAQEGMPGDNTYVGEDGADTTSVLDGNILRSENSSGVQIRGERCRSR